MLKIELIGTSQIANAHSAFALKKKALFDQISAVILALLNFSACPTVYKVRQGG